MEEFVDALLVIGILANLVKGGDLFLRESQKQKVQDISESITIYLDDLRPISWLRPLTTQKAQHWIIVVGVIEFVIVMVVAFTLQRLDPVDDNIFGLSLILTQLLALVLSGLSLPFIFKTGPKTMSWLLQDERPLQFLCRFLRLIVFGYVIGGAYQLFLLLLISLISLVIGQGGFFNSLEFLFQAGSWQQLTYVVGLLMIWPAFTYFWIVVQSVGLILWLVVLIIMLETCLLVLRGFAWRVVEYSKGAYAALLLAVTIILGLVSLFLSKGS
ncbi:MULTISPECIES: hypothetical protein [unclassified Moorena]|uniref:hypothetical protein n=1 Tax=unclassified Moorena TaxID=2683338 RepID=UPI0013C58C3B|nr:MULTISPECIES: hypothetical protein [unclassified Moorena]NEO21889.1 hypothetical protein [Moorena sp. SIO4A5]NEQ60781.1 hypothetical protein [Moorena sp. SIO4A1]